jgi:hypothetical protein
LAESMNHWTKIRTSSLSSLHVSASPSMSMRHYYRYGDSKRPPVLRQTGCKRSSQPVGIQTGCVAPYHSRFVLPTGCVDGLSQPVCITNWLRWGEGQRSRLKPRTGCVAPFHSRLVAGTGCVEGYP